MSVVTGNAKRALPASEAGRRVRSCEFGAAPVVGV
jgi:hypothetical protein